MPVPVIAAMRGLRQVNDRGADWRRKNLVPEDNGPSRVLEFSVLVQKICAPHVEHVARSAYSWVVSGWDHKVNLKHHKHQ
jgi:hypothetical protein